VRWPDGFPETPWYQLEDGDESSTDVVRRSFSFRREHCAERDLCRLDWIDRTDARAALCAWLVANGGARTRLACERDHARSVNWSNAGALQRAVASGRNEVEHDFAAMVCELLQRKRLLRDDAKTARPNLRVVLDDERGDTSQPLPKPESLLAAPKPAPRVVLR
jgi:hypothetical protein